MSTKRLFTASLIIGVSGSGKTSLLETYAMYLWETHRMILLLYSWDGGAIPTQLQRRMKQGLIRFFRARTRSAEGLGLETLYLATKGYWPKTINPETGEVSPAVEMIAPVTTQYTLTCPAGHLLKAVPFASLIVPTFCPTCKVQVTVPQMTIAETVKRAKGFEQVGGVAYDGLTAMCGLVLDEMDRMRGHGHIGGEKPAFGGAVVSGGQKFGGNNRADFGFAQTRANQFVNNSLSIPYLVEGPVFTALSAEVEESNLTVVGPKLAGSALIDVASAWFGNVLETAKVPNDQGVECHTLYTLPFVDRQGRRHLLKSSASPGAMQHPLVDPPEAPFSRFNLGVVFQLLDQDLARQMGDEGVLVPAPESYGEPATVEQPAIPAAPAVTSGRAAAPGAPAQAPAAPAVQGNTITGNVAVPITVSTPAPVTPPPATATARPRPTPAPAPAPAAPVTPPPPAAAAPPVAASTEAPVVVKPNVAPPPVGMKPPQRAPGT